MKDKKARRNAIVILPLVLLFVVFAFGLSTPTDFDYEYVSINYPEGPSIKVSWSEVDNATGYNITVDKYIDSMPNSLFNTTNVSDNYIILRNFEFGERYIFRIFAFNLSNTPPNSSNLEATIDIPDNFFKDKFSMNFVSLIGSGSANISWSVSGTNSNIHSKYPHEFYLLNITSIEIFRNNDFRNLIEQPSSTTGYFIDTGLSDGTSYQYTIRVNFSNQESHNYTESFTGVTNPEITSISTEIERYEGFGTDEKITWNVTIKSNSLQEVKLNVTYEGNFRTFDIDVDSLCDDNGINWNCSISKNPSDLGSNFVRDKNISTNVTAKNAQGYFGYNTSNHQTIIPNARPFIPNSFNIQVSTNANNNIVLTCDYPYSDSDEDPENTTLRNIVWYRKNTSEGNFEQIFYSNSKIFEDTGNILNTETDTVKCQITPHDGIEFGIPRNSTNESLSDVKFYPEIKGSSLTIDRINDEVTVRVNVTARENVGMTARMIDPYSRGPWSGSCTDRGNGNYSCIYTFEDENIIRGTNVKVNFEVYLVSAEDYKVSGSVNKTSPNARPELLSSYGEDAVRIDSELIAKGANDITRLTCDYSYLDKDGDSIIGEEYKWYVQKNGIGNFLEVFGQTSKTLEEPYFKNKDKVICSVRIQDNSSLDAPPPPSNDKSLWGNSSYYLHSANIPPILLEISDSSTFQQPIQVGETITFSGRAYDEDEGDSLEIVFCRDDNVNTNMSEDSKVLTIGDEEDAEVLWMFKKSNGLPLEEIRIVTQNINNSNNIPVSHSYPIYDLYIYEVNSYGEIPENEINFISRNLNNILVANETNRLLLNNVNTLKDYYAIRLCRSNHETGVCINYTENSFEIKIHQNDPDLNDKNYHTAKNKSSEINFNFSTNSIRFYTGLSDDGKCGFNTLCSAASMVTPNNFADVSCDYQVKQTDNFNQSYTAFAIDSLGAVSRLLTGNFYVNKFPYFKEEDKPFLQKWDGSNFVNISNNVVNASDSLYCNFTVYENINNYSDWKNPLNNYSITWWYKGVEDNDWNICDNTNICPVGTSKELSYGVTRPGDKWKCQVTPKDKFSEGEPVNSSAVTIFLDEDEIQDDNSLPSIIHFNQKDEQKEFAIPGEIIEYNLRFRDIDSNVFSIFICEGNITDTNNKISLSGCLQDELYRNTNYLGTYGINDYLLRLIIPEDTTANERLNFTVFVGDGIGFGKSQQNIEIKREINVTNINVVNATNISALTHFENNKALLSDNLECNFTFTDEGNYLFDQNNYSSDKVSIKWFVNSSLNEFVHVDIFDNQKTLSNLHTKEGERWFCQISFNERPDLGVFNSSNKILVTEKDTISNNKPVVERFFIGNEDSHDGEALVDQGKEFIFTIEWNDSDGDSVYAFICDTPHVSPTGCYGETISYFNYFTNEKTINIAHTIQNNNQNNKTVYAFVCDESYECSNSTSSSNLIFYINNKPSLENVTVNKSHTEYTCNYDYFKENNLSGDDEDKAKAEFRWIISLNGVQTTVSQGVGQEYETFVPDSNHRGILLCEVKVTDDRGLTSDWKRSNNFKRIERIFDDFEIYISSYKEFINTDWVIIRGYYSGTENVENKNITAYLFEGDEFDPNPTNNTNKTYEYNNPSIFNTTILNIVKYNDTQHNETLIYLNGSINIINFQGKYIGFERDGIFLDRYNFTYYNNTPTKPLGSEYLILNITEEIHTDILIGDKVHSFQYPQKRGSFEINVTNLSSEKLNIVKLVSEHGAEKTLMPIVSDRTFPRINQSTGNNDLNLRRNDIVKINLYDENSISIDSTYINISKDDKYDLITFNETWDNYNISGNLSLIINVNHFKLNGEEIIELYLSNSIDPGTYNITIITQDLAGNENTSSKNYTYDRTTPEFQGRSIEDNITKESDALKSNILNVSWEISDGSIIDNYSVVLYKYKQGTQLIKSKSTISNETSITFSNFDLDENACYFARIQAFTIWGVAHNTIVQTNCIPYVPTEPRLENIEIKDNLFDYEENLVSNQIRVSFEINEIIKKLIQFSDIILLEDGVEIDNKPLNFENNEVIFSLYDNDGSQKLPNDKCYRAKFDINSIVEIPWIYTTDCLNYFVDDSLKLNVVSDHFYNGGLFFNEKINFTINTNNAINVNYKIIDMVDDSEKNFSSINTDVRSNSKKITIDSSDPPYDRNHYQLDVEASSISETITESYIITFDRSQPEIINNHTPSEIFTNDSIYVNLTVKDHNGVKRAWVVSNQTGENVTEYLTHVRTTNNNEFYFEKNLSNENINSNTEFSVWFYAEDYAKNEVSDGPYSVSIENRKPINTTILPEIYWNASSHFAQIDLFSYFIDPDGDRIEFEMSFDELSDADIYMRKNEGVLFGNFRRNMSLGELNITLNVTDEHGEKETFNLSIKPTLNSCKNYNNVSNRVFVGFSEVCEYQPPTPPPTPPPSGGSPGSSTPRSPSSGGSGPSTPPPSTDNQYRHVFQSVRSERINIVPNKVDIPIEKLSLYYSGQATSVTIEIKKLIGLPRNIPSPENTYEIVEINANGLNPSNIQNVNMEVKIRRNNNLGINENNAVILRWHNNEWQEYTLTYLKSDNVYYYYSVNSPGLSYWVISRKREVTQEPDKPVEEPKIEDPVERPHREEPDVERPEPVPEDDSKDIVTIILYVMLVLVVLGMIGGGTLIVKQKNKQKVEIKQPILEINPLPEYIRKHLDRGIPSDKIKATLINAGWAEQDIEDAFNNLPKKKIDLATVDMNIINQISFMTKEGNTRKEIKEKLLSRKIPEEVIESCFNYSQAIKELKNNVRIWIKKGYTIKQIRSHLIEKNWPVVVIYQVLKPFNKK